MFTVAANGRIYTLKSRGYKDDGFIYYLGDVQGESDVLGDGETGIITVISRNGTRLNAKYVWDGFRFVFSQ